jgi:hypothetical protein
LKLETFLRAAQVLIHAGGFRLVVLDFSTQPAAPLYAIPRSTWFRLLRAVERSRTTALLVLSPAPITTTCSTLTLGVRRGAGLWRRDGLPLMEGADVQVRVVSSRRLRMSEGVPKKPAAAVGVELRR